MRKLIRKLIKESLFETREIKQQFYSQVRSQFPDIDNAYWVAWWGDGSGNFDGTVDIPVWDFAFNSLSKFMTKVNSKTTFDIPCNLVDPAGKDILPHMGDWGPLGIVFKGIPTAGFSEDVGSMSEPRGRTDRSRWRGTGYISGDDFEKYRDLFGRDVRMRHRGKKKQGPAEIGFDEDISSKPFLTHQPRFRYSEGEFAVVPKKIVGIVYHNDVDFIGQKTGFNEAGPYEPEWDTLVGAELDPKYVGSKMKEVGKKLGLPVAVGPSEISKFYRSLYKNNQ